jgi:hypothetical protein
VPKPVKKKLDTSTLAGVEQEMAKARMDKSARNKQTELRHCANLTKAGQRPWAD